MADGSCDFGDPRHPRTWILTRLSPPVTIELCDEHIAPGLVPLLANELGIDFETLYAGIEKILKAEAKRADKALAQAEASEAGQVAELEHQGDEDGDGDQLPDPGENYDLVPDGHPESHGAE